MSIFAEIRSSEIDLDPLLDSVLDLALLPRPRSFFPAYAAALLPASSSCPTLSAVFQNCGLVFP